MVCLDQIFSQRILNCTHFTRWTVAKTQRVPLFVVLLFKQWANNTKGLNFSFVVVLTVGKQHIKSHCLLFRTEMLSPTETADIKSKFLNRKHLSFIMSLGDYRARTARTTSSVELRIPAVLLKTHTVVVVVVYLKGTSSIVRGGTPELTLNVEKVKTNTSI